MRLAHTVRHAIVAALSATTLGAQDDLDAAGRRFRFAETFLGFDLASMPASADGSALALPSRTQGRFTIGGLHFWGHADFAVTVPLGTAAVGRGADRSTFTTGVETRGRWYPRPLRRDGVSPFVGGGFGAVDLSVGDGPREYRIRPMAQAGLAWRRGRTLLEVGWSQRFGTALDYPVSRVASARVEPSPHAFWIGAHRLFETTSGLERDVRSGAMARYTDSLRAAGRLSGPSIGVGLSSLILTGPATYNRESRPWLATRPRGTPALDVGLGWYFDRPDVHVNLAWRQGRFDTDAYGFQQENRRRSLAVEAYKFLGDYHGFVPFIGPVLGWERLSVRETDATVVVTDAARELLAPGITFGWDIRPTRAQPWILRTNLRWFPRLRAPVPGGEQAFDQLEFNFIQLVWYPRR